MLFKCGQDYVLRRCIRQDEVFNILRAYHDEPSGGHYSKKRIIHKVLETRYYWSSLHKDVKKYVN